MLEVKGENLFRFIRKTVLNGVHCKSIELGEEVHYTEEELKKIMGYIYILHPHDRVLLLNVMRMRNFPDEFLGLFDDEMKFIKKNYKAEKWDFHTKKAFKDEIKKIFKVEETEQG